MYCAILKANALFLSFPWKKVLVYRHRMSCCFLFEFETFSQNWFKVPLSGPGYVLKPGVKPSRSVFSWNIVILCCFIFYTSIMHYDTLVFWLGIFIQTSRRSKSRRTGPVPASSAWRLRPACPSNMSSWKPWSWKWIWIKMALQS